jgi:hypothetical protein
MSPYLNDNVNSRTKNYFIFIMLYRPFYILETYFLMVKVNVYDRYAVVTKVNEVVVGHVPREFSKVGYYEWR